MKIAIVTQVFLGGFGEYTCLKGDLIGGAEIYLHTLIKKVLEPLASRITVYQEVGVSKRFSEKTSVITTPCLHALKLNNFDLVIINGLQFTVPKIKSLKTKSIAIHHGMIIPPPLTVDTLRASYEYDDMFSVSAKASMLYMPAGLSFGETIANLSLKPIRILFREKRNMQQRQISIVTVNRNSAKVDCVVSVDKNSLNYVHPSKRPKWIVIYNFVDFDLFNPKAPRRDTFNGRTILVARNLRIDKGVFIIPRLAYLLKKWEYHHFKFLIAGEGHLRPFLENEIRRLKLENEVVLLGHQDHFRDMPRIYANGDISLVPTFANEGTSLAVLESMGVKKPVVTTDVGGINDIGVSGKHKLSSPFNIKKIGRNITRLIEDETLMKRIAEAGYRCVCRNHSIYLWKKKWQEVIEDV